MADSQIPGRWRKCPRCGERLTKDDNHGTVEYGCGTEWAGYEESDIYQSPTCRINVLEARIEALEAALANVGAGI